MIDTSKPFVLVGLSFGGMVAVELSKIVTPVQLILISSASSRNEIPPYFRAIGVLGLHRLVPGYVFKIPNPLAYWVFGIRRKEEKALLRQIMRDSSPVFLKWAVSVIVTWRHASRPNNLLHAHGASDRLLPARYVQADIVLENAGHFMIWNRAAEISGIINKCLAPYLR